MNNLQIDVLKIQPYSVTCNLYTGDRCVKIGMATADYEALVTDGFFLRDGKEADSADVFNTTRVYLPEQEEEDKAIRAGNGAFAE